MWDWCAWVHSTRESRLCIFLFEIYITIYAFFRNVFESYRIHAWQDGHFLEIFLSFSISAAFLHVYIPWRIDGCIYRIWREVAKRSVRSFMGGKERRGDANDNGDDGRKKDRRKVEIQRGKEAEKCSAVLVDRHALKKITVSTGILRKKEQIGEQVRILLGVEETPRRKSTGFLNAVLPRLFEFHDFCWTARFLETWGKRRSDRRSGKRVISTKIEDYLEEFWNAKERDLYILTGIKRSLQDYIYIAPSFFSFHLNFRRIFLFAPLEITCTHADGCEGERIEGSRKRDLIGF